MENYIDAYVRSYEHKIDHGSVWATTMNLFIPPRFPRSESLIYPPDEPRDEGSCTQFSLPLDVHVREHDGIRFHGNAAGDLERIRASQKITHTMYSTGTIYKRLETRYSTVFDKDEETVTFDAESMEILASRMARLMERLRA